MDLEEILDDVPDLDAIPRNAARSYESLSATLAMDVDDQMLSHPEVDRLAGGLAHSVMRDNHRNHAAFMSAVFTLGDRELLGRTLPWAYRAYLGRGFAPDYFPEAMRAWLRAIQSNLSAEDAAALGPVYEWIIARHDDLLALAEAEPDPEDLSARVRVEAKRLVHLLLRGDAREAVEMAERVVSGPERFEDYYVDLLQPAMYEIGKLWELGKISVAEEHMATAVAFRVLSALYTKMPRVEKDKGAIVVACVPNEYHELGARVVADILELDGWHVLFLGSSMPVEELLALLRETRPDIIMLSASMSFNLGRVRQLVEVLGEEPDLERTRIMVGGRAFTFGDDTWQKLGAGGWAPDARRAVELARAWWVEAGTS